MEGPWAHVIAVLAKLLEHPLAHYRIPKTQQDFAARLSDMCRNVRACRPRPEHAQSVSLSDIGFNNILRAWRIFGKLSRSVMPRRGYDAENGVNEPADIDGTADASLVADRQHSGRGHRRKRQSDLGCQDSVGSEQHATSSQDPRRENRPREGHAYSVGARFSARRLIDSRAS